jgi:hypothetical protein
VNPLAVFLLGGVVGATLGELFDSHPSVEEITEATKRVLALTAGARPSTTVPADTEPVASTEPIADSPAQATVPTGCSEVVEAPSPEPETPASDATQVAEPRKTGGRRKKHH